jgi:hypothetical protein
MSHLFRACALAILIPLNSHAADPGPTNEQLRKEIGIEAVLTAYADTAVEKRIRDGKVDDAMQLLTAEYMRVLPRLREFDAEIASEPHVRELRDRVVKTLQTRWLKDPPTYLDDASAEYLERTCATIPGCPKGRVHPLKEPVIPPME